MSQTLDQYDHVIQTCRDLFEKKLVDYGAAWRILRLPSLTDQIYIKAQRIRSIQQKVQKIQEDAASEFIGIINYSVMALIQLREGVVDIPDIDATKALAWYDEMIHETRGLMLDKNHDY